jgi:hypothetical protein
MKNINLSAKKIKKSLTVVASVAFFTVAAVSPVTNANATTSSIQVCDIVTIQEVVCYLNALGYNVYWIQTTPGSATIKAGVGGCRTVTVYVSGGSITGHLDSGNN